MDYKDQHWIPKSYLKAWCDPAKRDKVVHRYSPEGAYLNWRPYTRIFSIDDLYTVYEDGRRDVSTESAFRVIENAFLRVRAAIEGGGPWPASSKQALALFVAATRNRSPAARDHWQSFKDRVVKVGDDMERALKSASPAERQRMARASRGGIRDSSPSMSMDEARAEAAQPFGQWVLRHVVMEARILETMSFAILKAPPGVGFITSDNPVVWHDARSPGERPRRLGLGDPFIEVSMPITPALCVLFDHLGKDGTCDVNQATVDMFNDRTLRQCQACFIANSDALTVDWFEAGEPRT